MEKKKTVIYSIVALVALALLVVGATYAYFQNQYGPASNANVNVKTYTTDMLTFETGVAINISADQETFALGKGNATGSTFARATLQANNKTNNATENYNLFLNISDNTFVYSVDTNTPELIITIKDKNNNEVTSIEGLTYKTVTDGKGTIIKGFDITNKNGLLTLFNKDITTTSTTVEEWNVTVTFVNYNKDQTKNAGKKLDAQLIISKDNFSDYTPNTINTLSASKSGNNLTVNLNLENGSNPIDKYYYAIKETNGLAILDSKASIKRLSNRLAVSDLTYVESNNSSYTFANIKTDANYNVYVYAVDNKKIKTNTYNYKYTGNYNLPVISKVETSKTSNSITATVTATKGTNNITKYYYSIDNGSTFTESTSNSYTFSNLSNNTNYRIVAKVMDTNGKYSNTYVVNEKIISSSSNLIKFTYAGTEYSAEKGMTFTQWAESEYNTFGYYIEEDTLIEENKSYENFYNIYIENWIYKTEGLSMEGLSETNLKTIYIKDNYNDIGKTYGYLGKIQTYNLDELYAYANGLNANQKAFLQNFIDLNLVPMSPVTIFVNIDTTVLSPDSDGYYTIPITAEVLKNLNIDCVKLLMFDGITDNFSNPQIEDYDYKYGIITLKAKGNFVIAFFRSEE